MKRGKTNMFVVVGVHRSGTSVLARGLKALGVDLGDRLLKPLESENPKGYWEDIDLLLLSDKVLTSLGRRWETVKPLLENEFTGAEYSQLVDDAVEMISRKTAEFRNWGFKNPRTGQLIPFWRAVFRKLDIEAKYLVTVRNPINVVHSLVARNHFAPGYCYALWTSHYLDILRNLADEPTVFVSYENLVARPEQELRRAAGVLDIAWDDTVAEAVSDYAENFVADEFRHYRFDTADLKSDESRFQQTLDLYELLKSLCAGTQACPSAEVSDAVAAISRTWRRQGRLLKVIEQHETGVSLRLAHFEREIQAQHEHLSVQEALIAQMREETAQREERLTAQEQALDILRQEIDGKEKRQLAAQEKITELADISERRRSVIAGLERDLNDARTKAASLESDIAKKEQEFRDLSSTLDVTAQTLAGLEEKFQALAAKFDEHVERSSRNDARYRSRLKKAAAEIASIETKLANKERRIRDLLSRLESTAKNLSDLDIEYRTLASKFDDHADRSARGEARYRNLLAKADRAALALKQELGELGAEHAGLMDEVRDLKSGIVALKGDRNKLEDILARYETAVASLLESSRWRTGNAIGEVKRRLLRRPEVPMATHFIKDLSVQFHDWKDRDRTPDPEQGARADSGAARILSGNRAAILSRRSAPAGPGNDAIASRTAAALTGLAAAPPVSIVIPIYNAADDLRRCLQSVVRNTTSVATLCLIDDASPDPEIAALLRCYAGFDNVEILLNESNLGFTGTVNRGLTHASGDVVVLNSDTVVGPRWLENLRLAAYSDATVGTVTAISDNAGAFSFPVSGQKNRTPPALADDDVARLVWQESARVYPDVPTGNGFCLYVKRSVIERIGLLDIENFPRGYGEENDYCMRAMNAGFHHLIDDSTYVRHREGSSFEAARDALMKTGTQAINRLYPEYDRLVASAFTSAPMARAREAIGAAFASAAAVRPRVLYLVHQTEGGMTRTIVDLIDGLDAFCHCFVLMSDGGNLSLLEYEDRVLRTIEQIALAQPIYDCRLPHPEYRLVLSRIVQEYRIELAHMHHLLSSSLDIGGVLKTFGIPLVLSVHDYFYICPTVNLLDQNDAFCAGHCTAGEGQCPVPIHHYASIPGLKHGWVVDWRRQLGRLLRDADAVVAPSRYVHDLYRSHFPDLEEGKLRVIEHGRNFEKQNDLAAAPSPGAPARILVPGVISRHKGAEFIRRLAKLDAGRRLEFHFLGRIPPQLEGVGVEHGPYEVSDLPDHVREIAPSFVGLFSITSETYGHVLTEAWSCGVPALVLDIGAQADRVASHGGGWVLDPGDPASAYRRILEIVDDADAYSVQSQRATLNGVPTVGDMGREYDRLYRHIRFGRRAFGPAAAASVDERPGNLEFPLKLAAIPQLDAEGSLISSAHIRLKLPLEHSVSRNMLDYRSLDAAEFLDRCSEFDAAIVQRTALSAEQVDRFIDACRDAKIPYVLDLDDDLLALDETHIESDIYARQRRGLQKLVAHAALVLTSTSVLAERYRPLNDAVAVIPNALDEGTWFAPMQPRRARNYEGLGLLYMGTETHAEDLVVLKGMLQRLAASRNGPEVRLFVIGGEPAAPEADFYTRIPVPPDCQSYPQFVDWLLSYRDNWDIGLAPLAANAFNEAKSHLKYLEYSALGLPGIYADLAPYNQVVAPMRTGLLAAHTPEAWCDAVTALAASERLRGDIAAAAHEDLIENHLLGNRAGDLVERIVGAVLR